MREIDEDRRLPVDTWASRGVIAATRIVFGLLWLTTVSWKTPPEFRTLRHFTEWAYEFPVFPPYAWFVENVVIPNMTLFGWVTLLTEMALGAFLILGLATRFWAVVGLAQTVAISLSILNGPHEWSWAYYMMFAGHALLWATAAGRAFGLDAILRPGWAQADGRVAALLRRAS